MAHLVKRHLELMLNVLLDNALVGELFFTHLYYRDVQCTGRGLIDTVRACPEYYTECGLFCQDSNGNCFQFNGNLIDGTPCGETGRCKSGQCTGLDQCNSTYII